MLRSGYRPSSARSQHGVERSPTKSVQSHPQHGQPQAGAPSANPRLSRRNSKGGGGGSVRRSTSSHDLSASSPSLGSPHATNGYDGHQGPQHGNRIATNSFERRSTSEFRDSLLRTSSTGSEITPVMNSGLNSSFTGRQSREREPPDRQRAQSFHSSLQDVSRGLLPQHDRSRGRNAAPSSEASSSRRSRHSAHDGQSQQPPSSAAGSASVASSRKSRSSRGWSLTRRISDQGMARIQDKLAAIRIASRSRGASATRSGGRGPPQDQHEGGGAGGGQGPLSLAGLRRLSTADASSKSGPGGTAASFSGRTLSTASVHTASSAGLGRRGSAGATAPPPGSASVGRRRRSRSRGSSLSRRARLVLDASADDDVVVVSEVVGNTGQRQQQQPQPSRGPTFDPATGRCPRHPSVVMAVGDGVGGGWKVVRSACPKCTYNC